MNRGKEEITYQTQKIIQSSLDSMNHSEKFIEFDWFLLEQFLPEAEKKSLDLENISEKERNQMRKRAYLCCYQQFQGKSPVSRNTLRTWFRMGKKGKPKRSQLFAFAFALHMSPEQLEDYFVRGLQEPGIQVNDYREIIYCYGLENKIAYEECQDMMEIFEREVNRETVIAQNTHTEQLWKGYKDHCHLSKEEFLNWMCQNGSYFKGYSKVALNWFIRLKHEMLEDIRKEAKEQLFHILEEKGFMAWAAENGVNEENYGKEIPRYLRNVSRRKEDFSIPKEAREEIASLNWIVYSSKDKNSDMLAELYSSALDYGVKGAPVRNRKYRSRKEFALPECVYFMTDKYVSQLLGVAQQKEKEIRLSMARSCLLTEERQDACPEWVRSCMETYDVWKDTDTVGETLKVLNSALDGQKQRCQQVKRSDLLILIHYVAQKRYQYQLEKTKDEYVQREALTAFTELAEEVLGECNMIDLDEKYQLDYLFLHSFGEEEMYTLSDVIEIADRFRH